MGLLPMGNQTEVLNNQVQSKIKRFQKYFWISWIAIPIIWIVNFLQSVMGISMTGIMVFTGLMLLQPILLILTIYIAVLTLKNWKYISRTDAILGVLPCLFQSLMTLIIFIIIVFA